MMYAMKLTNTVPRNAKLCGQFLYPFSLSVCSELSVGKGAWMSKVFKTND